MNRNLKIGDLVCFNSAGMRHKTLGVVLEFDYKSRSNRPLVDGSVLIMWSAVGKYMPRTGVRSWRRTPIVPGEIVWHELGDWFMEVKWVLAN